MSLNATEVTTLIERVREFMRGYEAARDNQTVLGLNVDDQYDLAVKFKVTREALEEMLNLQGGHLQCLPNETDRECYNRFSAETLLKARSAIGVK